MQSQGQDFRLKEASIRKLNRLAGKAVWQYGLIQAGDRVLVGLSGGKDSLALLYYLLERRPRVPIVYDLVVAHINLGYEPSSETKRLRDYVRGLGLESCFEDTRIAYLAHSEINTENPCFLCARLRRKRLFELARDHGCSKVALGHHREDLIETLLLNIFYSGEISTMLPRQEFFGGLVTVVRPLCMVPEATIRSVVKTLDLPVINSECPSAVQSRRREIKEIIERLTRSNKKVKGNLFRSLSNYRPEYLLSPENGGGQAWKPNRTGLIEKENLIMDENQRKRTRVHFKAEVDLSAGQKKMKALASRDLSLKGLFVETRERLPLGTKVDVALNLTGASSLVSLSMKGRVARVDEGGMGIDFDEIDLDSFYHLRNIILYNIDEPSDVESELATKPAF
ncbi:MAG: ATP-binding protein [Thermodesulfobacteriota bacterium]